MTSFNTYRTGDRRITITRGSEGPRHDPYSYTEITVSRKGWCDITYHEGLAVWLRYKSSRNGRGTLAKGTEAENRLIFEKHLGCSLQHFERACHRARSRCRICGGGPDHQADGYPGESFTLCAQGHVIDSNFNDSSII